MESHFKEKVAIVTGGGSGIGKAACMIFSKKGAKVVVVDINSDDGNQTVAEIESEGGEAVFLQTDVSKASEVKHMIDGTIAKFGRIDCAFNNAGIEGVQGILTHEYEEQVWDRVLGVNLKGVWLCMKYEIPQMLKQGSGSIVNTSSIAGLVGSIAAGAGYAASKHGVIGLTKTAALENAKYGIRVNVICPGGAYTPMTERIALGLPGFKERFLGKEPIGRFCSPEEIAAPAVWLCSDNASFVTGHTMSVDGGFVCQ